MQSLLSEIDELRKQQGVLEQRLHADAQLNGPRVDLRDGRPAGSVFETDEQFLEAFGTGEIPFDEANVKRARALGIGGYP